MSDQGEPLKILVLSASLRADSLNTRLARLAADALERHGATADLASMHDFDAPSYDGDVEAADGMPPGPARGGGTDDTGRREETRGCTTVRAMAGDPGR